MNFEEQLSEKVGQINQALLDALPAGDVKPSRLHEAIRHSSEAGGKRLRPVLLIAAMSFFKMNGIQCRQLWRLNVFIHTA